MQTVTELREHCLSKRGTTEDFPFGFETLVLRVRGKIFALTDITKDPISVNLKCNPERSIKLREEHPDHILPGWHMNKRHWNTVLLDGTLPETLIQELIDHSYTLVVRCLPKQDREDLGMLVPAQIVSD
ncbi:MmcQ/YjbR family DNA-binding protein [Deinococcus cellulosilyticus]|uniref:DNA-binding protein n=1 Tax=Deinococcus cellulosilyticus (strain DSM 18568 / NBRC 106333 / KACC 11606 / 5516J-15) TaxID=1223518 RepID=A0A511N4M2_DEIC1|nr:MmcQ/YjbR family DNA-binding protein [Deinococcus cellulosilyticus]GEM47418.1 DNA-binding protein [Deinococcus cellulosilyticus NBRC 106333 = KACC 11606]